MRLGRRCECVRVRRTMPHLPDQFRRRPPNAIWARVLTNRSALARSMRASWCVVACTHKYTHEGGTRGRTPTRPGVVRALRGALARSPRRGGTCGVGATRLHTLCHASPSSDNSGGPRNLRVSSLGAPGAWTTSNLRTCAPRPKEPSPAQAPGPQVRRLSDILPRRRRTKDPP